MCLLEACNSRPSWDYFALLNLISEDFQNTVHEVVFYMSVCSMSSFVTSNFFLMPFTYQATS
jgi:hypothetical protein